MVVDALNQLRLCRQSKDQTNWSVPIPERPGATESRDESEWEDGGLSPEQQRARSEVGPPYNSTVQYSTVQYSTTEHNSSSIFGFRTPFIPSMHNMQIVSLVITQSRGVLTGISTTTSIGFVVVGQEKKRQFIYEVKFYLTDFLAWMILLLRKQYLETFVQWKELL